jgi:hypothetical protein
MKKNDGGPPLAGTVLHVTWNLNEVFEGEELILGAYNEIMQMGAKLFLEGLALGETAKRCFPPGRVCRRRNKRQLGDNEGVRLVCILGAVGNNDHWAHRIHW